VGASGLVWRLGDRRAAGAYDPHAPHLEGVSPVSPIPARTRTGGPSLTNDVQPSSPRRARCDRGTDLVIAELEWPRALGDGVERDALADQAAGAGVAQAVRVWRLSTSGCRSR
jgi:hypothetical protein